MNLYANPDKATTKKMLIAANYAELDVEIPKNVGDDVGRIPVLETSKGCIFHAGAILRYIGKLRRDVPLCGQNLLEAAMVDSWTEFSVHELEVPLNLWVSHAKGTSAIPPEVVERAKADTQKALTVLNNHLLHYTFMVTDGITLADISLCCVLAEGFTSVLAAELKGSLTNLVRWFNLCMAQPAVQKVMGKVEKIAAGASKGKGDKKEASPKAKPAAAPKKDEPKKEAASKKAASPKAAPVQAGGAIDEAAVKAVGDEIRILKDKLKEQGITGKKLNDHPEIIALVAKLGELKSGGGSPAPKKAAAPAQGSPKASPKEAPKDAAPKKGGKKDKGGDAPAGEKELTPEQAAEARKKKLKTTIKEGGKRGVEIEGAADMGGLQFFCTSVDAPEGDLELLEECMTAMNATSDPTEEERKGGSGNIGKMIFSCATEHLALCAYVPEAKLKEVSCEDWLKAVLQNFQGEIIKTGKTVCIGKVNANSDKGIFPLKIREPMILEANNFLRKLGLFPEDNGSDDDEMVFGDDDFPS